MLTSLIPQIDLTAPTICSTLEEYIAPVTSGDVLAVNIPLLMPYIAKGEPKMTYDQTNGSSVFANAFECTPAVKWTLRTLNYLEVTCERNSEWSDLYETRVVNGVTIKFLPEGTKMQCKFVNGKLTHPTVNTDTYVDK